MNAITEVAFPVDALLRVRDARNWEVADHFNALVRATEDGNRKLILVVAHKGFVTDLASIPQVFWNIFPPFGNYSEAAITHDYLYRTGGDAYWVVVDGVPLPIKLSRAEADLVFKLGMKAKGVGLITRTILYTAVKVLGKKNFRDDAYFARMKEM